MPVLDPAEKGRGGGYAHTMFVKEPMTKDFPAIFFAVPGWYKWMEEDRVPSSSCLF